jgi:predicted dehydrogenase
MCPSSPRFLTADGDDRGNWRSGAPSLLTKCCHDIDLLLWVTSPHTPSTVSSHGSLVHFRRSQKPVAARAAKNCLSCPAEPSCIYSAKKIYVEHNLHSQQNKGWPNKIVAPEIEDAADVATAEDLLLSRLREDGDEERPYYGRCVYEAGNNVVDNQVVVLSWDDDVECTPTPRHGAKTATLTMIAHTEKICERFTKVYGTKGELTADSNTIKIYDFASGETRVYNPEQHLSSGHGGGDIGLSVAFVDAIAAVKDGVDVDEAQRTHIRCTPEEAVRSHEVVFWAEQARVERRVIGWNEWRN